MTFNGEYFQQTFGVIMDANVAPLLAKIYLAKLEKLLLEKCKTDKKKLVWPKLTKFCLEDSSVTDLGLRKVAD